eukprot:7607554-Pyramimonas_sp.AAC.1
MGILPCCSWPSEGFCGALCPPASVVALGGLAVSPRRAGEDRCCHCCVCVCVCACAGIVWLVAELVGGIGARNSSNLRR